MKNLLIFDLSGTLVKMRPASLLVERQLLTTLKGKFKLAIVTGAKRKETENILKKLNISSLFELIITKDDSAYKKPDNRIYKLLKKQIQFDQAIYIGDTKKDYLFAKNSNIPFYYVGTSKLGEKQDKSINKLLKYIQTN